MSESEQRSPVQKNGSGEDSKNGEKVEESDISEQVDEDAAEALREKSRREREARAQALTLEIVGDLPYAEVKPPENVLFVCKLNPVTEGQTIDPLESTHISLTNAAQQMRIKIRSLVASVPSYPVKSFETSAQKTACNMHLSNSRTRKTASRRTSRCKES